MKCFNVKICGMTCPSDTKLAIGLGANMIGMIFYRKSPRYVTIQKALGIVKVIPPTIQKVGVFVDTKIDRIFNIADKLSLEFIQFHGDYSNSDILKAKQKGYKTIKVFHINSRKDYKNVFQSKADLVLLDNKTSSLIGGTGIKFDWGIRPPRPISNLILAGGINSLNVKEGIKIFSPLAIDVCSSVESKPGRKSIKKMREFFEVFNRLRYGQEAV